MASLQGKQHVIEWCVGGEGISSAGMKIACILQDEVGSYSVEQLTALRCESSYFVAVRLTVW